MDTDRFNLKAYLAEKQNYIDLALNSFIPSEETYPEIIYKAMRYSVFNGGKRLRPILTLTACEAVGGILDTALAAGCAIEMIHAFSLIHDDLPALDNDDLRRGKPTCHKVFGEAIAILAGDALFARAFEILTSKPAKTSFDRLIRVVSKIASAAGTEGMAVGQVADIISEGKQVPADTLMFIHKNKTGALIEASVSAGGILGGGSEEQISALSAYGWNIGQAFQIVDDILDIEGNAVDLGKPIGSDIKNEKTTYPSLYGLERSKELAKKTVNNALMNISAFDEKAEPLRSIARYILTRKS